MRTKADVLADLREVNGRPPRSWAGSLGYTTRKNALLRELAEIERDYEEHHQEEVAALAIGEYQIEIKIKKI